MTALLAVFAAGLVSVSFLLLNNLQLSLENPFAGELDEDADPDDICLDELQVMTYLNQDASVQAELQRQVHIRRTDVSHEVLLLCYACQSLP